MTDAAAPRCVVTVDSMAELLGAMRERVSELGINFNIVDEVCGFPDRYTAKLLAPGAVKNPGPMSFDALLGCLGLSLMVVPNAAKIERVKGRFSKSGRRMLTADEHPLIEFKISRRRLRKLSRLASTARKKIPAWRRRQIARRAARARWGKD